VSTCLIPTAHKIPSKMEVFTMEICEICGSTDIIWVEDDELEDELFICHMCYKKMFGDPPLSCSNMYN